VAAGPLTLELRATDAGQVGLFPEHAAMLPWLAERIAGRVPGGTAATADGDERPDVLHLFAATGLATLAMADAGAAVVHLDAAKPTVAWARRNAELSGLAGAPIRWIVDDAMGFVEREARRGRRYAGIVLDPPSYGHAAGGRRWQLEDDLDDLLVACAAVLDSDGFMLLTAHTPNYGPDRLEVALAAATRRPKAVMETGDLGLTTADGRTLELGGFARTRGGA
jgi:23S rRNA (cytosine1962-C5)-methyltransferase